jgi:hypothetical protein
MEILFLILATLLKNNTPTFSAPRANQSILFCCPGQEIVHLSKFKFFISPFNMCVRAMVSEISDQPLMTTSSPKPPSPHPPQNSSFVHSGLLLFLVYGLIEARL